MKTKQLISVERRLNNFLDDILSLIGRSERRHWGAFYVRGLLSELERKSITPIAEHFRDGNAQAIQQLLHSSPWDHQPVRQALTRKALSVLKPVEVWIIDDTGFPKKGEHSVGVARQYSGTLGAVGNCQIAVSLNYATETASFPMDWELYLPRSWTDNPGRLKKAGLPEKVPFRNKLELALELIDRTLAQGFQPGVIVADACYGSDIKFRQALEARHLAYVIGIRGGARFWRERMVRRQKPYEETGLTVAPRYDPAKPPQSAHEIAAGLEDDAFEKVAYYPGSDKRYEGLFALLRVQSSHRHHKNAPEQPMQWLLIEKRTGEPMYKFYLSNLEDDVSLERLVRLAKMRWRVEMDYQTLKGELGLDHYEGRSWRGWHHHVTLVMAAFLFLVFERSRGAFPPDNAADG